MESTGGCRLSVMSGWKLLQTFAMSLVICGPCNLAASDNAVDLVCISPGSVKLLYANVSVGMSAVFCCNSPSQCLCCNSGDAGSVGDNNSRLAK